ncbi:MAG: helix-turn-helix domain-containing protein [Candidatus Acidiferrales bacterium]
MKEQLETLIAQLVERGILYDEAVTQFEKRFIGRVLEKNRGNLTRAARDLGIHRNTLSRKIELYKLAPNSHRH